MLRAIKTLGVCAVFAGLTYQTGSCVMRRFQEYERRPFSEVTLEQFLDGKLDNNKVRIKATMIGAEFSCGWDNHLQLHLGAADGRRFTAHEYNWRDCATYERIKESINKYRGQPVTLQTELTLDGMERKLLDFGTEQIRP